jgi:LAO/AO transport system kinase
LEILELQNNNWLSLARTISWVENDTTQGHDLLLKLPFNTHTPVVGITGPPGAGKSSLVNALIDELLKLNLKIGILAVDPTSPFNYGSLLGDRVRMANHFNSPNVFIRSLATRGNLGGLSAKIFEITDVMQHAGFDIIIIETVGVGQSEVEIAGLADTTTLVLVPEAGDEVQTLKSGVMEIADIFIVNKSDREGADTFIRNLNALIHQRPSNDWQIPVLKTIATNGTGTSEFWQAIQAHQKYNTSSQKKAQLLCQKAWQLIQNEKMKTVNKKELITDLEQNANKQGFNLYQYIENKYIK